MKFGISVLSMVPVRAQAAEQSEMVTQLLFGDFFEIIDYQGNWYKIRIFFDNYTGWIDHKSCEIISTRYYNYLASSSLPVLAEPMRIVMSRKFGQQVLVGGSNIPGYKGKLAFRLLGQSYRFIGRPAFYSGTSPRDQIIALSKSFLNAPYLWGGKSLFGMDCSGFTQIVFKILGMSLPRDASQQVKIGKVIDWVNEAQPGDLAFFDNAEGKIVHVGIILDAGRIIHASGRVRIDFVDHAGICNVENGKYSHQLRLVKNIMDYPGLSESTPIQGQLF